MTGKPDPAWVEPFLAALAETGNVTWSAQQAGVDFTTVYGRRNRRPAFAEAWAAAIKRRGAAHSARLVPPAMPGRRGNPVPSQELVERVCSRNGPQLVRLGAARWSARAQDDFLAELAATGNVRRSAAAVGFSPTALYRRRLKERHFAEAWDAAVATGRARIEAYLVEVADRSFDPDCMADPADLPRMTVAEALKFLQLAGRSTSTGGGRPAPGRGWTGPDDWPDPDDEAEVAQARENIIARLERLRDKEEEEKLAGGWTRYGDDWVPPGFAPAGEPPAAPDSGPRVLGL